MDVQTNLPHVTVVVHEIPWRPPDISFAERIRQEHRPESPLKGETMTKTLEQTIQSIVNELFDKQPVSKQQTVDIIRTGMQVHLDSHLRYDAQHIGGTV